MIGYLPFGDYWHDGHGQYTLLLVEVPDELSVFKAQQKIKQKYGVNFFDDFANDYGEANLSRENWQALIDTEYPVQQLIYYDECNDWSGVKSLEEALKIDPNPCVSIDFVENAFVWLLNAFGAEITVVDQPPIISMSSVGYGCFWV